MKLEKNKKIIIINITITIVLIAIFTAIFIFIANLNSTSLNKIKQIKLETVSISVENSQSNQKILDIDKYEKEWEKLTDRAKSTKSLKSNEVNSIIETTAKKYYIQDLQFAMKIPTILSGGKFKKKSIDVYATSVSMSFSASDDYHSMMFLKDLFLTLPGNVIIENLSLTKTRVYNSKDYIEISKNGKLPKIKIRIKFHWYSKKESKK